MLPCRACRVVQPYAEFLPEPVKDTCLGCRTDTPGMSRWHGPAGRGAGRARREQRRIEAEQRQQRAEASKVAQEIEVPASWTADRVAEVYGSPAASEARHKAQMKASKRESRRLRDAQDEPLLLGCGELVDW